MRAAATTDNRHTPLGIVRDVLLVTAFVLSVVAASLSFAFGYRLNVVEGRSMDPTLPSGSLVVTRPVSGPIEVGSIVKFRYNGLPVMHRVIAIDFDGRFVTKGDNPDQRPERDPVPAEDVIAEYAYSLPPLGGLWHHIFQARGVVVGAAAAAVFLLVIPAPTRKRAPTPVEPVRHRRPPVVAHTYRPQHHPILPAAGRHSIRPAPTGPPLHARRPGRHLPRSSTTGLPRISYGLRSARLPPGRRLMTPG